MHPPTKDQADIGVEDHTLDASDGPDNKDVARQEFAKEADINYMLERFNVIPPKGTPAYGEWDYTLDLQDAIDTTRTANRAYRRLPEAIRNRFRTIEDFIHAVETGTLVMRDGEPPPEPAPPVA